MSYAGTKRKREINFLDLSKIKVLGNENLQKAKIFLLPLVLIALPYLSIMLLFQPKNYLLQ